MKKTINATKQLFGLLLIASLIFACSAEDGEDGAIGPQGPQGEQGASGPQGEQGEQGETGSANVIFSDWIATTLPDPIASNTAIFNMAAPELSAEIRDSGVILVYGRAFTTDVYGLPATFNSVGFNETHYYRIDTIGEISIRINSIDGADIGARLFNDYRYILIPGGIPASGKSTPLDYAKMTYEEIVELFNIPQ